MRISIAVPPSAAPRGGNWHTGERWAGHLRAMRHRVRVVTNWRGGEDDVLIALHARKSLPSILRFADRRPDAALVVVLTGTDLYRDIRHDAEARQALGLATRLIVLQQEGLKELSSFLRAKTSVVYQSSDTTLRHAPEPGLFRIAVIGHLREEKDPFRAEQAVRRLGRTAPMEVLQIGGALNREMRVRAEAWKKLDKGRYRWLGSIPHVQALRWLSKSHLLVVSSIMEGGANVICEAARIGVPVLASRIPGNLGMLGRDYRGYYPVRDDRALARLIERARDDTAFYRALKQCVMKRRALFAPAAERAALNAALRLAVRG